MVAPNPTDSRVIYVGTNSGGVWKTTTGGHTWTPVFDDQPTLVIGAIAINPENPQVVYAGSRDGTNGVNGSGLFSSLDGGGSWAPFAPEIFGSCFVTDIVVRPDDPETVAVAAWSVPLYGVPPLECQDGVWRSTDGGNTWALTLPTPGYEVTDLVVDPVDPSVWYAGVRGTGVLKSTDGGATWARPTGGPAGADVRGVSIVVAPSAHQRLYAVFPAYGGGYLGVWTSPDAGQTWERTDSPPSDKFCSWFCWTNMPLAVSPNDPDTLYIGDVDLWRTEDGGISFKAITNSGQGIHVDVHGLAFDASGRLWIGSDGGVYRTRTGDNFTDLNRTLSTIEAYQISGSLSGPLMAGLQDNGTVIRTETGTWVQVLGGDGGALAVDPTNPRIMYATVNLQMFKSRDGGRHWFSMGRAIKESVCSLVLDPARHRWLYAGASTRVYRTTNGGKSWTPISPTLGEGICALGVAPGDNSTIYAASLTGQLQITTDGGSTWRSAPPPGPKPGWVTDIAVNPNDPAEAYVGEWGFGRGHVFHTTDSGATWIDISEDLPDVPVDAVAVDWARQPAAVYIGTNAGIYALFDGSTWVRASEGMPASVAVTDLLLDRSAGALVAATWGRGLYRASLPTSQKAFAKVFGELAPEFYSQFAAWRGRGFS